MGKPHGTTGYKPQLTTQDVMGISCAPLMAYLHKGANALVRFFSLYPGCSMGLGLWWLGWLFVGWVVKKNLCPQVFQETSDLVF